MSMGGNGGGGTTTSTATIAPEVKPIVTGAGNQVLALQNALPLTAFAGYNPQQIPGISPMQQQAINYAGAMSQTPTALSSLLGLGGPMNQLTQSMLDQSGYDSIADYRTPLAGMAQSLFNSSSTPGSMAGRQAGLDTLAQSGRVGQVNLGGMPPSSEGSGVNWSSLLGGGGQGGSGGGSHAATPPQLGFQAPPSGNGGNGFQFDMSALEPWVMPGAGSAPGAATPNAPGDGSFNGGPVPDIIGQVINTHTIGPAVVGQPVPEHVALDTTAPTQIYAPYSVPWATQPYLGTDGGPKPSPGLAYLNPPTTPVGVALIPPGTRMPDPSTFRVNNIAPNSPYSPQDYAYNPYFTPIEVAQMAQNAGTLPGGWFDQNQPVTIYGSSIPGRPPDETIGYVNQGTYTNNSPDFGNPNAYYGNNWGGF